ncbi:MULTISPECIES: hypothetical protein [unclassified Brevundimonas]|uniref:hypothetical protein n=1 Tax=unclassified Brevundimonas TaxID=2622653 RepID=UPI003B5890AC
MTDRTTTPEADLAFLRAIVEGGASGRGMLTMGVAYMAGGLLYGIQCLFHIAQMKGWILWPAGPSLLFIAGVTVAFCLVMVWSVREDRKLKVSKGPLATRTMNAAFTATGMVNLAVIIIFGVGSARDHDFAVWLYYPAIVFAAQAAAWFVAWSLKKRAWMLATAAGGWLTAVALGLLVRSPEIYMYICTAALFLLFALPGWIMIRGALQVRAAA